MTEFGPFRPLLHPLHIETSFDANKEITEDEIKDKLLSGFVSVYRLPGIPNLQFFLHFKQHCHLLSGPKERLKKKKILSQLNLCPMLFKEEGRSSRKLKHFFCRPTTSVSNTVLIQEN